MDIDSEEISDFVRAVLSGIREGIPQGSSVSTSVKFQIGIKSRKEAGGNLKLTIAGIGAKRSSEEMARVEFEVDDAMSVVVKKFDELGESKLVKAILKGIEETVAAHSRLPS